MGDLVHTRVLGQVAPPPRPVSGAGQDREIFHEARHRRGRIAGGRLVIGHNQLHRYGRLLGSSPALARLRG